mgnify:CR=1 FL=1
MTADTIKSFFKNVFLIIGLILALVLCLAGIGFLIWKFVLPKEIKQNIEVFITNPNEKTDSTSAAALANALDTLLGKKS